MKSKLKLLFPIAFLFLASGCWDKVELESRGFVVSLGIDLGGGESPFRYSVSASLPSVNGMRDEASNDSSKTVKKADGPDISSALSLMGMSSSQKLYLGQARLVIFGAELLGDEERFKEAIDACERNHEIGRKIFVLSTKGKASDILEADIGEEPSAGIYIENYYRNASSSGTLKSHQGLSNIISDLRSGGNTLIPEVELKYTQGGDAYLELGGCAAVKGFKLAGFLDSKQTRGFEWVMGDARGAEVSVPFESGNEPLSVSSGRSKIRFQEIGGNLECNVDVKVRGSIAESGFSEESLYDASALSKRSVKYEEAIKQEILDCAKLLQEDFGADAYGFLDMLRKRSYSAYKRVEGEWEENFKKMKIIPNVTVDIISAGAIK
ncbi:MAG: Ger(x)C family spore germination protein [Clostridiales bacterium]|jgi:Ger(x)C family germination protein|nr:Ger(x)C family spore germination protein [Clostridiales bacterium]